MFWFLCVEFIKAEVVFPTNREWRVCEWQHWLKQNLGMKSSRLYFASKKPIVCSVRNGTK